MYGKKPIRDEIDVSSAKWSPRNVTRTIYWPGYVHEFYETPQSYKSVRDFIGNSLHRVRLTLGHAVRHNINWDPTVNGLHAIGIQKMNHHHVKRENEWNSTEQYARA